MRSSFWDRWNNTFFKQQGNNEYIFNYVVFLCNKAIQNRSQDEPAVVCAGESFRTAFHGHIVVSNQKATKFAAKLKWLYSGNIYLLRVFYPHSHRTCENVTSLSRIWFQSDKETFVFLWTTSTCAASTAAAFALRNTAIRTTLTRTHSSANKP